MSPNHSHKPHVHGPQSKSGAHDDMVNIETVHPHLAQRIHADRPDLAPDALIPRHVLADYRSQYVESLLRAERGDLSEIERRVTASLASNDTMAANMETAYEKQRTLGERLADALADFGGSWPFLVVFAVFLLAWMAYNNAQVSGTPFDPYPFILLNLILSTIAAVQAPIIMMSQKRQEAKDRMRSLNDYQVNLKAELEIRHLHEKIDHLLSKQWQRLAEIQQLQLELLHEKSGSAKP